MGQWSSTSNVALIYSKGTFDFLNTHFVPFVSLGSVYRDLISESILKLQESQMIHKLYTKWWKEVDGGGKCEVEDDGKKDASELGVSNVGGVFVVLMAGMAAGLVVAFLEFVWKARKNANEDKVRSIPVFKMCWNGSNPDKWFVSVYCVRTN